MNRIFAIVSMVALPLSFLLNYHYDTTFFFLGYYFIYAAFMGYLEITATGDKKLPFMHNLLLLIVSPVAFPLIEMYLVPNRILTWWINRTTVRGIFVRFDKRYRDGNVANSHRTRCGDKDAELRELEKFFKKVPSIFEGLPGGLYDIVPGSKHLEIQLSVGECEVDRFSISRNDVLVFINELDNWSKQKKWR